MGVSLRLEWLEDIIAVAETGSFTEAARRRNLTQSAFSRRIRHIEESVGVELFDRSRKPVQLRPSAYAQIDRIARAAITLRQIRNDLRDGDRSHGNRIVIASQHSLTTALTPRLIEAMHARRAGIAVRLRSANLDECFSLLLGGRADLALVYKVPGEDHPIEADFLETLKVTSDLLVPVASPGLAARLTANAAGDLDVIAYPPEVFLGGVQARLVLPALAVRFTVARRVETALTLAAMELAVAGLGVAWVPRSLVAGHLAGGRLREVAAGLPTVDLDIEAIRLSSGSTPAEIAAWDVLVAQRDLHEGGIWPNATRSRG